MFSLWGQESLKITPKQPVLSLVLWVVPMIRSHTWEWGPPTPRHHPVLQCLHYIMHLQIQLILRNLTGPSQLTSLLLSPYQTAPTPWTTGKLKMPFQTKLTQTNLFQLRLSWRTSLLGVLKIYSIFRQAYYFCTSLQNSSSKACSVCLKIIHGDHLQTFLFINI